MEKITVFHSKQGRALYRIKCPECGMKYSSSTREGVRSYHEDHMILNHQVGPGHPTRADRTTAPQHRTREF